jgi:hypothetical protein
MDPRISVLTFPQAFDGANLHVNILFVPRLSSSWSGDPLLPVIKDFPNPGDTTPAFADADLRFRIQVLDGLGRFPSNNPIDFTAALPAANGVTADARPLFQSLVAPGTKRFTLSASPPRLAAPPDPKVFIRKYLPRTYRESFLFNGQGGVAWAIHSAAKRSRNEVRAHDISDCAFERNVPVL